MKMAHIETNNNTSARNKESDDNPPAVTRRAKCAAGCRDFALWLFNPTTKAVMGRTGLSWLAILGFYVAFYAFFAAYWAACLAGFLRTIDYSQPTQQHKYSLLKDNPGMTFYPMVMSDSTLIWFNSSNNATYSSHVQQLTQIVAPYISQQKNNTGSICSEDGVRSDLNHVCIFDYENAIPDDCKAGNNFGFSTGKPCIFLRPNKVFAYMPTSYDLTSANLNQSLDNPPASLYSTLAMYPNSIAVTCEGEQGQDSDSINSVNFFPQEGFPFYFYPYLNQQNYLPPFVMAQFDVIPNRVIMIWCRIWANGIKHDATDMQGSIHFELMVDGPPPEP